MAERPRPPARTRGPAQSHGAASEGDGEPNPQMRSAETQGSRRSRAESPWALPTALSEPGAERAGAPAVPRCGRAALGESLPPFRAQRNLVVGGKRRIRPLDGFLGRVIKLLLPGRAACGWRGRQNFGGFSSRGSFSGATLAKDLVSEA